MCTSVCACVCASECVISRVYGKKQKKRTEISIINYKPARIRTFAVCTCAPYDDGTYALCTSCCRCGLTRFTCPSGEDDNANRRKRIIINAYVGTYISGIVPGGNVVLFRFSLRPGYLPTYNVYNIII